MRQDDAQNEKEGGGAVESMSIEATNAMRLKLGLAPLREGASKKTHDADALRRDEAKAAETAALAEKIAARKRQREIEKLNAATTKLGDADDEEEDAGAWLAKSKTKMATKAQELERAKAAKVAAMFAERDEDAEASASEEEDEGAKKSKSAAYTSKDLRGLKVRHTADEINEGQEVVLTLKDTSMLDDEDDELENVLIAERKSRKKARKESTKKSDDPFGEGKDVEAKKTVLGKYDAHDEDAAMELDGEGGLDAAEEKRKAEIKARLAAELSGLKGKAETAEVVKGEQADFHTQEEMQAKFVKREKKKKMRKKLRKKHIDAAELEQDALAPESSDLGSRRSRGESSAEAKATTNEKDAKFANALQKAREVTDKKILAELAGEAEEEEDDELARALARSRKMANISNKSARSAPADVVAQVAARRQADEAKARENAANVADESLVFTDMSEFVQGINTQDGALDEVYDEDADTEEMPDVPPPPPPGGEDEQMDDEMPDVPPPPPQEEVDAHVNMPVLAEKHVVQKGLASTLALLKDKAQLDDAQNTRWSGRANDMKDRFDRQHVLEAHAIEEKAVDGYKFGFKLDKFDEFGRKLTPKEAFRELCHRFHGIEPGKMKREKRLRQFQEEQQRLKASSVMDDRIKDVQRDQATPYVVLSGHVRAGQARNADPVATMKREQESARATPAAASRGPSSASGLKASNATKVSFAMKPSKK